jgi:hypothetical protein
VKVGDLVRVQYPDDDTWYSGFLVEVAHDDDPMSTYQMYCVEREALHILSPGRDLIEVISEE